jgi:hypothetical protein
MLAAALRDRHGNLSLASKNSFEFKEVQPMNVSNAGQRTPGCCAPSRWRGMRAELAVMLVLCLAFPILCTGGPPDTKLTISLERVPDPPGKDTVTLKAALKNVSKESVLINVWHPLEDYSLTVTDCRGARVALSKHGEAFFSKDRIRSRTANVIVTLEPGETRVDTWAIDDFFQFSRPGCYRVAVQREFVVAHETDSSNTLEVVLR